MKTFTPSELEALTGPQLVSAYNEYAEFLGEPVVKKFSTKPIGQKRTWDLMAKAVRKCDSIQEEIRAKKSVQVQVKAKPKKAAKKKPVKADKEPTISDLCRNMILDGATNDEIFKALQAKYGEERFNEDKKHYPAWYRCELRRKRELPPAFDPQTAADNIVRRFED